MWRNSFIWVMMLEVAAAYIGPAYPEFGTPYAGISSERAESEKVVSELRASILMPARQEESQGWWSPCQLGLMLGFILAVVSALPPAATAADDVDLEHGRGVFSVNCASCHAGGKNAIITDKGLVKEALITYNMYDIEKIKFEVSNGRNAMPAFGQRLGPNDIDDVANYILSQAAQGWGQ